MIKKLVLTISISVSSCLAQAELINGSTLSFTPISVGGVYDPLPADGLGSWFSMEVEPGLPLVTPLSSLNGVVLGTSQPASSFPLVPDIDNAWIFFGNIGVHQSISATNVLSASGDTATIDFSGWGFSWNGITHTDLSSGAWNGNAEGVADVVCDTGSGCRDGAGYILNYSAVVPEGDVSGFGGVKYALHLEGIVSAIPLPASVWLFGSGLVGLTGLARRRAMQRDNGARPGMS